MRIRTGYSFRVAVGHLGDVISRIQELKWKVAPISDTNSTFGFNKWTKAAKKAGLRPIYGVELSVATPTVDDEKSVSDRWTFFAKKDLRSLHELIALATTNCDGEPSLTYMQAWSFDGIKIAGSSCQLEYIKDPKRADLYIGLSPSTPKALFNAAKKKGFKFLAVSDNVYPRKDDKEFYRITLGKRANTATYPQWILSDQEWRKALEYIADKKEQDSAIKNRDDAIKQCTAEMKHATLLVPEKPKTLRQMCIDGAKRVGINLKDKVYSDRLNKELKLIEEKKFEDYFYVISDMVNWAKQRMIVGPARGSSCGSLVCYLLNITTIDPIPYGLIFERFIDTTRTDLPDIDIDFSDQRRQMVFDYAEKKYGKDRVARLGTVTLFKPTSALNAAGVALQIPKWQVSKVLDGVIERSSGDSRAMNALEDTLAETENGRQLLKEFPEVKIAAQLEGHPNNSSQHAAGIVITQEPITEYVAVDYRTKSAMVDKKDAEDLNLLKIDALGLTQLSIFERVLQLIGKPDKNGYLESLPLNDKKAFDVLNKGHWAGIFQFTGGALQSLAKQIKTEQIEDMISITALARPGPMATGGANSWVKRKTGQEEIITLHPMLTELTKETQGVVTYQEQCMNIMRTIGNFSWEDTSAIRKAMSGRLGNEFFEKYRVNFIKGAKSNGIKPELAEEIFNTTCTFGCLSGDTILDLPGSNQHSPKKITIKQLFENGGRAKLVSSTSNRSAQNKRPLVQLYSKSKNLVHGQEAIKINRISSVVESGIKQTFELNLGDKKIRATKDHQFLTKSGWRRLEKLKIGQEIAVKGEKHKDKKWKGSGSGAHNKRTNASVVFLQKVEKLQKKYKICQNCKQAPYQETHHIDFDRQNNSDENLLPVCRPCHKSFHDKPKRFSRGWKVQWSTIKKIHKSKNEMTYDISMEPNDNYVANDIVTHNSWAFNRSHAVAYGLVSYWACYLKAHHPMEFAAATLDAEADPARQIALLRELKDEGIDYVAVDPDHSTDRWVPVTEGKNKRQYLVGPLTAIKGIGPSTVIKILEARKKNEPLSAKLIEKLKEGKTALDTLYPIADRVKHLHPDLTKINIVSKPTPIIKVQCDMVGPETGRYGEVEVMIIGVLNKIAPKDENEQVNIMKREAAGRKGVLSGPTAALNLFAEDDSDEIFCKIDRWNFERIGREVVERGRAGKAIYAIKGTVPKFFRMISVTAIKYLGDMDMDMDMSNKEESRSSKPSKLQAGEQNV
jgi:DNA polymerase III alpha subunit